jgi:hypothetical protein
VPKVRVKDDRKPEQWRDPKKSPNVEFQRPSRFVATLLPHVAHGHRAYYKKQLHAEIAETDYFAQPRHSRRIGNRGMEGYHHEDG